MGELNCELVVVSGGQGSFHLALNDLAARPVIALDLQRGDSAREDKVGGQRLPPVQGVSKDRDPVGRRSLILHPEVMHPQDFSRFFSNEADSDPDCSRIHFPIPEPEFEPFFAGNGSNLNFHLNLSGAEENRKIVMAGDPTVEDCEDDGSHAVPAMVAALAARIDAERALLRDGEEEEAARVPIPSCPGSLDNLPAGEAVDVDSVRQPGSENRVSRTPLCGRLVVRIPCQSRRCLALILV